MTQEEYNAKTRPMVNFLSHIYSDYINALAAIQVAQAEQDTKRLIGMLEFVKGKVEDWIEELKAI